MPEKPARYQTYLLTAWQERSREPAVPATWRFSLLDPSTGQRRGFASLEVLVVTLKQELAIEESNDNEYEMSHPWQHKVRGSGYLAINHQQTEVNS